MRKLSSSKFSVILTVLITIFIPLLNPPAQAQKIRIINNHPDLKTTINRDNNPQPLNGQIPQIWVVRVYFTTRQQVAEISAWIEPWEMHYEQGYLVVGVFQDEYKRLKAQGFRIDIDHAYTERVNHPLNRLPNQNTGIPGYDCYRTLDETYSTAQEIVTNNPTLAEWIDIGDSWEKTTSSGQLGNDLMVLKLTNSAITDEKPKLFIMAAVHAREYATAELNTRFAEYLISNYEIDPDITWLLDYTEIHLLLQSNPDGRKQAETGLYWRKNTNENYCSPTSTNRGADLNRNFEFHWGCCAGSSGAECDALYRGPSPASEPETQAIQNYVRANFPDQRGELLTNPAPDDAMGIFLDIHSYGELVLWPWGFTSTVAPNDTALQTLGRKLAYFNDYEPDQAVTLYPTDGTTDDFAYGDLGLAAYTFELGTTFFQDCSTFETTIWPDNLKALLYAAKTSRAPYLTPAGPDALNLIISSNPIPKGEIVSLEAIINDTRFNNSKGIEPSQNIIAAEFTINTPPWETGAVSYPMSAADSNFNSPIESVTATINTSGLSPGRHTIFVRGQDAEGNWGAVSAVFLTIDQPQVFGIEKTPSTLEVLPGDVFTYTLEAHLTLTGTNSFTLSLTDSLPNELNVLIESIRVNGTFTNGLYTAETHTIQHHVSGFFTEEYAVEITFQVQVGNNQILMEEIINQLDGQANINGVLNPSPTTVESIVNVIKPQRFNIFFPLIMDKR